MEPSPLTPHPSAGARARPWRPLPARSAATCVAALVALALGLTACDDDAPAPPAQTPGERPAAAEGADTGGTYERDLVFASVEGDSILLVPWLTSSVEATDSVRRVGAGWLARGGIWDAFYEERWSTPTTRAPQRVLPHGSLGLVVRDGDAIDGILYEEGPRNLEVAIGEMSANWVGSRGETVEVLEGAVYLSEQRIEGAVLDLARASAEGTPSGGDWAFLLSGNDNRFVLMADTEHGGEAEPVYQGWADLDGEATQWPEIRMQWRRTEAFPPARRDVPVDWHFESPDGAVVGDLSAISSDITAGEGPGPLLPVRALVEVTGRIVTADGTFEVGGLVVHERR